MQGKSRPSETEMATLVVGIRQGTLSVLYWGLGGRLDLSIFHLTGHGL